MAFYHGNITGTIAVAAAPSQSQATAPGSTEVACEPHQAVAVPSASVEGEANDVQASEALLQLCRSSPDSILDAGSYRLQSLTRKNRRFRRKNKALQCQNTQLEKGYGPVLDRAERAYVQWGALRTRLEYELRRALALLDEKDATIARLQSQRCGTGEGRFASDD